MHTRFSILVLVLLLHSVALAQEEDYFEEVHLKYENYIYKDSIHTVLLHKEGWELTQPLIKLNTQERLLLSFDDFRVDLRDYGYTIIHCNANWQPSDLFNNEYIEGVPDDFISDYEYSRSIGQRYIHYNLFFPSQTMKPIVSGNYILLVYEDGDRENIVLTRRFMVLEERVDITARIKHATDVEWRFYKQEVDFSVTYNAYQLTDPFQNVKVALLQNHRWDNGVYTLQPVFVKDNELDYDHNEENVFFGSNEFRFFDVKDLRFKTERIEYYSKDSLGNHCWLKPDLRRSSKVYIEWQDLNGKRFIKVDERGWDSDTDADYVYVHFTLPYDNPAQKGDFYIYGELTDWRLQPAAKLKYNYKKKVYENTLYLKQGYYNYMYVYLEDGQHIPDETFIEGTHFDTENNYTVLVYHRTISDDYDRLVGVENFNSIRNR